MNEERLAWIDAVKGIAIIGIVVSHVGPLFDLLPALLNYIVVVKPSFIFISGYLFIWEKYKIKKLLFLRRRTSQLMLPVYATGIFALFFQYVYWLESGQVLSRKFWTEDPFTVLVHIIQVDIGYYSWFHSVWFLSALFVCEIVFFCIACLIKSDKYRILTIVLLAASSILFFYNTYTPFFFAPALASLIFFTAGYLARKYNIIKRLNILVLAVVGCIYALVCSSPSVRMDFAQLHYSNPVAWVIGTLAGSIFLLTVVYQLYTHNILSKSLEFLGKNSLFIMLVNIPVLFSLQRLVNVPSLPIYPTGVLFVTIMVTLIGMICIKNIFLKKIRSVWRKGLASST
jgi:fucose 4-O-acetylase-like acetyltransferase